MTGFTLAQAEAHNARVAAEAQRAAARARISNDHTTRLKIPHAEQRERKAPLARSDEGETQGPGCPLVCFTLRRVRLLDIDAKFHSCKDIIDGLQIAGLIRGDKEGQIGLEVRQEKVASFKYEETIIEITYP